jgi:small subunit ribosomal protein S16
VVKIRLKRIGKKREPYYRLVVTDSRTKRDGRVIEEIGTYYPQADPSQMSVVSERVQYWLSVGAKPSPASRKILEVLGEWAKFRHESVTSQFQTAPAKPSAEQLIQAASDQAEQIKAEARQQAVAAAQAAKAEAGPVDETAAATADETADDAETAPAPADQTEKS